jgi:hypothetical protein
MKNSRLKAIRCTISRGGFSDERVFKFAHNGQEYKGIASRLHMWKSDLTPVEEGEPPLGQTIDGFVAARIIEVVAGGSTVMVSIPDGEVITIPIASLEDRPIVEAGEHVSI